MSALHEGSQLNPRQRRALELLAAAGEQGCTGARLFNHGFTVGMLADLIWSGLATGHRETALCCQRDQRSILSRPLGPGGVLVP